MKRIPFFLLFLLFFSRGFSQSKAVNPLIGKKGVIYFKEWSMGLKMNTNGLGLFYERGKYLSVHSTRITQFEFDFVRHAKEVKQTTNYSFVSPGLESPKPFKYGKQNNFYTLNASFGYRKKLAEKANKNGVEVSLTYMAGASLGILKPYYLKLIYPVPDNNPNYDTYIIVDKKYTQEDSAKFLDWYSIYGSSGFSHGITDLKFLPGVRASFGINFDWSGYDDIIRSLEVGVNAEFYYRSVPIMVLETNKPFIVGLYIGLQLGKKT